MKRMRSIYSGKCRVCQRRFGPNTLIDFDKTGKRGKKAQHAECSPNTSVRNFYADSPSAARGVSYETPGEWNEREARGLGH